MGRHQAPEAPGQRSVPGPPPAADEPPTERIEPVRTAPAGRAEPGPTPPTYRLPEPSRPVGSGRDGEATAFLGPVARGATRVDQWPESGYGSAVPVPPVAGPAVAGPPVAGPAVAGPAVAVPPVAGPAVAGPPAPGPAVGAGGAGRLDDNTGTFTRVLLTGLGGSVEPGPPPDHTPAYALGPPPPAPQRAGPRAAARTRRLAARLAAARGDERTALVAVGAVVGLVVLLLAVLVVLGRLTRDTAAPAGAAPAPTPAATAAPTPTATAEPTPTDPPLPPAGGSFTARHSGLCLAVPQGRTDAGAQLVQRTCGTDFGTSFLLVAKDQPDTYELVDMGTSRCADVYGASGDNGAPVVQWDCNGGPNQTFQLRALTDPVGAPSGYVQLVAAHSGKCLDVVGAQTAEGAPVQQNDCRDAVAEAALGNQSWSFSPN